MLNALQINQNNYTLSIFPSSNRQNFEDCGIVLAISASQFDQSTAVQLHTTQAHKMVITTSYVEIDNCFCNTRIVVH